IYAAIDESKGKFGKREQKLPLEFRKRVSKISEVQVVGIDAQSVDVALAGGFTIDVDTNIPKIGIKNKDAIAVVIGNRNYENSDVPTVDFAIRDAAVMKEYLMNIFGYKDGNIIFETDATQGKFMSIFGTRERDGKLQNYVKKGQSDVFIYYSGHGAPDPESNDGYFVPIDCDPSLVAVNGYSLNLFYEKIYDMGAKSVTVVIDACFSGSSDQGMLLKNISPVFIEVDNSVLSADNALVFTSAAGDQVSSWYPEKKHSLFTYYFLKGLKGEADQDANKLLSANELLDYLLDNVSYMARRLNNREQTPGLQTLDEEKVLIRY
ncbi:MAG: caspase family protein, partial [Candidatus Marinimicrobia bacterium]|nr:caspase family protein [Candidatus Neomarinimicrobiota bacterium]